MLNKTHIPGEYIVLEVSDNGCGMDKETISRLFEPFFTTKELGKGTGLGLATIYGIVNQNNGFINVYSEIKKGTTFKIYIPKYINKQEKVTQNIINNVWGKGNEVILLVEDETAILNLTTIILKSFGYSVLSASAPEEALKIAKEYSGEIKLLITDVIMPEMNGKELADKILLLFPKIKRLFMSGYSI